MTPVTCGAFHQLLSGGPTLCSCSAPTSAKHLGNWKSVTRAEVCRTYFRICPPKAPLVPCAPIPHLFCYDKVYVRQPAFSLNVWPLLWSNPDGAPAHGYHLKDSLKCIADVDAIARRMCSSSACSGTGGKRTPIGLTRLNGTTAQTITRSSSGSSTDDDLWDDDHVYGPDTDDF